MFTHLTEAAAADHRAALRREADLRRLAAAARAGRPGRPGRKFRRTGGRHAGRGQKPVAAA